MEDMVNIYSEYAARVDQVLVKSKTSNSDLLSVIKETMNVGQGVQVK